MKNTRFLLKYGSSSDGYWNSKKFISQVQQAVTIAEIKYLASLYIIFLFDQSSGHTAYADDSYEC